MLRIKRSSLGFTFVELMVTLGISAFVFVVLMSLFLANVGHYQKALNANKLHQQLQSALDIMASEIRRAGFWANASTDVGLNANNNPFMTNSTDISVGAGNSCILFTYDHNATGSLPSIGSGSDDARYGFRLTNNIVMARPSGAGFSCNAADWERITDPNIVTVTALTFTLNTSTYTTGPATRGLAMRSVTISITGQLADDATISKTLTQQVKVRNDKFIP